MKAISQFLFFFSPLFLFLPFSCSDDGLETEPSVFTEEIIFVSGERVVVSGRVLAQGEVAVTDHGFEIDVDENFTNPIVISLGEKNIPGRFIGEYIGLNISLEYVCRSFMLSNGEKTNGNVLPFSTLAPRAFGFYPQEGSGNTKVTIEGRNLTADTEVFWNGQPIIPDNIIEETFVEIKAPPLADVPTAEIQLTAQGELLTFSRPFEYIIGEWTDEGPLDDGQNNINHVYFEEGEKIIYGLGVAAGSLTSSFKVLDKNSLQRSTIGSPAAPVEGAFFNQGYFGGGSVERVLNSTTELNLIPNFWKYENLNFTPLADMPEPLFRAVALFTEGKIYVYGGENNLRQLNARIYIYDIASNIWSESTIAPFTTTNAYPAFHLDGYNYIVTADQKTWRHDYINDEWDRVANFPTTLKTDGISLILDGNAYVGMQETNRRLYVYFPDRNVWRQKNILPDNNPHTTIMGWTHNGRIYVSRTELNAPWNRVLWSLEPDVF